jgi:hypothetical protein
MSPEDEEARKNAITAASAHPNDTGPVPFDVSQFELEDTAWKDIENVKRTGDLLYNGKPVRICVYSPGSKQGVRALHKAGLQAQLRIQATFRGVVDKDGGAQADEERAAKLTAITASIENFPIPGGAAALYANHKLRDIGDQVEEFFGNKTNFSKAVTPS